MNEQLIKEDDLIGSKSDEARPLEERLQDLASHLRKDFLALGLLGEEELF